MKIELKKLTHNARLSQETNAFAADIYIDGKKAGTAMNSGQGGPTNIHITDRDVRERFEAFCKAQPPVELGEGRSLPMDDELYIDLMVEKAIEEKKLRSLCKRQTVISLKDHQRGEYLVIKRPYEPKHRPLFVEKYGDRLLEIVNERFTA